MHLQSYVFVLLDMNEPMLQHSHMMVIHHMRIMSFVCGQSELKTIKTFCPTTSTLEVLDVDQPDF